LIANHELLFIMSTPQNLPSAIVYSSRYEAHNTGPAHPEAPARWKAIATGLEEAGLMQNLLRLEPRPATRQEILRCHTPEYFETAMHDVQAGYDTLSTGDTAISEHSLEVAQLAAGGVITAVDALMEGKIKNAFCPVRPPGHHATPERGMGFCLFNNIAIAARHAQAKHGVGKILIADWDVHHGNGTQEIFYQDGSVLFFDTHQHPWYPGTGSREETGAGPGLGATINCPFPAGAGRQEILTAFQTKLVDAASRFKPELIMISAGFDSRLGDPLGEFRLTDEDFADLTGVMLELAGEYAGNRLVAVLEGGYDLEGLKKASTAHVQRLMAKV
jgi:acetoin utilization deacetylase AcuC-like enzyme